MEEHFCSDKNKSKYYGRVVAELLNRFVGIRFNENEVMNKWKKGYSFGEIHSLALCLVCGYGYFLSDDNDSRDVQNVILQSYQKDIPVYKREELADKLKDSDLIDFKEYKAFVAFIEN